MVAEKKSTQHKLSFRFPANEEGFEMVKQMRKAVNKDSYKFRTLYTGKRYPSGAGTTKKENAETIRVYLDSKRPSDNIWSATLQSYDKGYEKGYERGKLDVQEEQYDWDTRMTQKVKEAEDKVSSLLVENDLLLKNLSKIAKESNDDFDGLLESTNEKEFNILKSKLLLINAYIGAIENKDNYSRRIEALKQVVNTINSITEIS